MALPSLPGRGDGQNKPSLPVPGGLPVPGRVTPERSESASDFDLDALSDAPQRPRASIGDFSEPLEQPSTPPKASAGGGLPSLPGMPTLPRKPINSPTLPTPSSTPPAVEMTPDVSVSEDADTVDDFDWDSFVNDNMPEIEPALSSDSTHAVPIEDGDTDFDDDWDNLPTDDAPIESSSEGSADDEWVDESAPSDSEVEFDLDEFLNEAVEQGISPLDESTPSGPKTSLDQNEIDDLINSLGIEPDVAAAAGVSVAGGSRDFEPDYSSELSSDDEYSFPDDEFTIPDDFSETAESSGQSQDFNPDDFMFDEEIPPEFTPPDEDSADEIHVDGESEEDEFEDFVIPEDEEELNPDELVPEPIRKEGKDKTKKAPKEKKRNPIVAFVAAILTLLSRIPILGMLFKPLIPLAGFITILLFLLPLVLLPFIIFGIAGKGLIEESSAEGPDNSLVALADFEYVDGNAQAMVTNKGETIANVVVTFDILSYAPTWDPSTWWDYKKVTTCTSEEISVEIDGNFLVSTPCEIDESGISVRVYAEAEF